MTPTLAQALSLIAPQYNAAQHKRAAERMVQDMEKTAHTPVKISVTRIEEDDIGDVRLVVNTNIYASNTDAAEKLATTLEAAPDLLAALEAALPTLQSHMERYPNDKDERRIYDAARAAIAKAKGVKNGQEASTTGTEAFA